MNNLEEIKELASIAVTLNTLSPSIGDRTFNAIDTVNKIINIKLDKILATNQGDRR